MAPPYAAFSNYFLSGQESFFKDTSASQRLCSRDPGMYNVDEARSYKMQWEGIYYREG